MANFNVKRSTKKLCPFAMFMFNGSKGGSGTAEGQPCVREACQLWVARDFGELSDSDTFQQNTGTKFHSVPNNQNRDDEMGRCGAQVSDFAEMMYKIQHHKHKNHEHVYGHKYPDYPSQEGGNFTPFGYFMPDVQKLSMEFSMQEDMDGNGKIYGRDFTIINDDKKPFMLRNLDNANVYRPPYHYVEWDDYRNNKYPPIFKNIFPLIGSNEGGHWVRLQGGFFYDRIDYVRFYKTDTDDYAESTNIKIVKNTGNPDVDGKFIYIMLPTIGGPFDGEYEGLIDIEIKNRGNTFGVTGLGIFSMMNTGGVKRFNKIFRLKNADELIDISEIEDDINNNTFTINYSSSNEIWGTIEGEILQNIFLATDGTPVEAVANTGYIFHQWDDLKTENPRTEINVLGDMDITAEFIEGSYTREYKIDETENDYFTTVPGDENFMEGTLEIEEALNKDNNDIIGSLVISPNTSYHKNITNLNHNDKITIKAVPAENLSVIVGKDDQESDITVNLTFEFVEWSDGVKDNPRIDTIKNINTQLIQPIFQIADMM